MVAALGTTAVAGLAAGGSSAGSMTPAQTMHALLGHWTCVTQDSTHHTTRETDTYQMWGAWLHDASSFPAQNGSPAGQGESFIRYDSSAGRWVITGVDTMGVYFTASSSSHTFNGSHWVDNYPADGGWANLHMTSANQVILDSSGPDGHGHTVTSHQVCTRS